jgi:antitoxin (DNA-binding transcriptional repressor) of toxin-antitoxin stability system
VVITMDVREFASRINEAFELVKSGGEVILSDGKNPIARIVPCHEASPRVPGLHRGAIQPSADFDAPLPDEFWSGNS